MCPHITKKRLKPLAKSLGAKQYHRSSYTIPKGPPKKKHGEQAKAKINASQYKITFISGWKSSMKGGRSISTSGWRKQRIPMVSLDGVTGVFRTNAHITRMYSST
jgi:hypothetical protein